MAFPFLCKPNPAGFYHQHGTRDAGSWWHNATDGRTSIRHPNQHRPAKRNIDPAKVEQLNKAPCPFSRLEGRTNHGALVIPIDNLYSHVNNRNQNLITLQPCLCLDRDIDQPQDFLRNHLPGNLVQDGLYPSNQLCPKSQGIGR